MLLELIRSSEPIGYAAGAARSLELCRADLAEVASPPVIEPLDVVEQGLLGAYDVSRRYADKSPIVDQWPVALISCLFSAEIVVVARSAVSIRSAPPPSTTARIAME